MRNSSKFLWFEYIAVSIIVIAFLSSVIVDFLHGTIFI